MRHGVEQLKALFFFVRGGKLGGSREQVAVISLPPLTELGEAVEASTDELFVVVEGNAEVRVGDYDLAAESGDLVFVEAGTRRNIINRAALPLRVIAVFAPPMYPAGTVVETLEAHESPAAEPWRPFPWLDAAS